MRIVRVSDEFYLAGIDRKNDILYIGGMFERLPEKQQRYILWHEFGHRQLDTSDEIQADKYAIEHYAGTEPYSIKNIYDAIMLMPDTPEYINRKRKAIDELLRIDCQKFNNQKACEMLYSSKHIDNYGLICPLKEPERSKCKAEKEQKREDRRARREDRRQNRDERNEAFTDILGLMANQMNQNNDKGKYQPPVAPVSTMTSPQPNNKPLYIGAAIAVTLLIILYFILK
jgi:hypothetical protein